MDYLIILLVYASVDTVGVLAMKTATAGTKACKKSISILPFNVAAV